MYYNENMLLVNYFDANIASSLIPIKTFLPEEILFLTPQYEINSSTQAYMEDAIIQIYKNNKPYHLTFLPTDCGSLDSFIHAFRQLVDTHSSETIYLNVTNSKEIMTIAGFLVAKEHSNVFPIYIDFRKQVIKDAEHHDKVLAKIEHIDLNTYITALGAKTVGSSHHIPQKKEYKRITTMAEYLFRHLMTWHAFCEYLAKHTSKMAIDKPFSIPKAYRYNKIDYALTSMANRFVQAGFLKKTEEETYLFPNPRYKEYLITYGIWLELYTHIKALEVFHDARLGYKIDWTAHDNYNTVDNEIDVVAIYRSEPIFISCKMTEPSTQDLNEVGYLARHLRGIDAHPVIMTTSKIREDEDLRKRLYTKFARMKVGLIEVDDFQTTNAKDLFISAIR